MEPQAEWTKIIDPEILYPSSYRHIAVEKFKGLSRNTTLGPKFQCLSVYLVNIADAESDSEDEKKVDCLCMSNSRKY